MAWWNEPAFFEGLDPESLRDLDHAEFPDASKWSVDPGDPVLRAIGARNVLQSYYLGARPRKIRNRILQSPWLVRTPPLPGLVKGTRALWVWLLDEALVCPVFVPGVSQQGARLIRFDVVLPKLVPPPSDLARAAQESEKRHSHSLGAARSAFRRIEPELSDQWLVLADDGGHGTRDESGSLGIALAAWAVQMQEASGAHEALPALTGSFSVTGILAPDGRVRKVGGLKQKLELAGEGRSMILPYAQSASGSWFVQAGTWEDAKALVAPRYTGGQRGVFPPCDVLIGVASEKTEPHLKFVAELRPRREIIILHSDDERRSIAPALRIKCCLEENAAVWGGEDVPVRFGRIDAERPHLIERELARTVEGLCRLGIERSRIVIQITGGNKMMAIAAANVARSGCTLMYLELGSQTYSVIGNDGEGRLAQVSFIAETPGVLAGFDQASVEICKGEPEKRKG